VPQNRPKAAVRGAKVKSKSGRRPPVKVKSGPELPLLPIAVGGLLVVLAIVIFAVALSSRGTSASSPTVDGIPCDQLEHTQVHYHVGLQIVYDGVVHPIPANIGIVNPAAPTCFYWLHVHPANTDTIHIESPANRTFTLSQFFAVWTAWNKAQGLPAEPLDATHVSTFTLTPDQKLVVYISNADSKSPAQLYTGDPNKIVLKSHEVITLEISPPTVTPPPPFTFAAGL
jgi:hypothetical protein